ncbi:TPA: hypothetical protein PMD70_002753 [Vibrio cholerae]|nr:hypothetical protein [Vibrio cholerae]
MKYQCHKTKKEAVEFNYQGVAWSGDKLPFCKCCGLCVYDQEFRQNHTFIHDEEEKGNAA